MLKKIVLALMPLTLLATNVKADDIELNIDVASIADADVNVVEADLNIDVDQLSADAGTEKTENAIEACFRSYGYHGGGWGSYGGYGHNCWNNCSYGYNSYYSFRPICYAPPVYRCVYAVAPVYNYYWGCY